MDVLNLSIIYLFMLELLVKLDYSFTDFSCVYEIIPRRPIIVKQYSKIVSVKRQHANFIHKGYLT